MRPSDALRLLALGAIWGSSYFLIKVALDDFTALQIVAGRLLLGGLVLLVIVTSKGMAPPPAGRLWWNLLFMAVIANSLPFLLIAWGEESISSSLASILNSTTPLFTAFIAALFLREERVSPLRLTGIVIGFLGVVVIVGLDPGESSIVGELAIVLSSLAYGCGFVFARVRITPLGYSPLQLSAGQLSLAALIMMPFAVAEGDVGSIELAWDTSGAVAILGIAGTGLAYLLYYRLVRDVGPTSASFVTFLIPIFGVVLGALILDEHLGWNTLAGGVLIVAGIALAEVAQRRDSVRGREQVAAVPTRGS